MTQSQHAMQTVRRDARKANEPRTLRTGIGLARIAGIEIRMDVSVLVIAALVAFNLAAGLFPAWHPEWSPAFAWFIASIAAALLFASILAHELAHALVAKHFGLPVHRIVLFIFGGMAEIRREPDRPKVELLIAVAGPAMSFAIGIVAILLGSFAGASELGSAPKTEDLHRLGPVSTLLLWLGPVNVMLGLFNLVPGFPLDGGRVLRAIIWWKTKRLDVATRAATRAGQVVAGALVLTGVMMMFGYRVPVFGTGLVPGLWLVLIGWFLYAAALRSYEQMLIQRALVDVPVSRIMFPEIGGIPASLPLRELERLLLHADQRCFPVIDDGRLAGLVCLEDLRRLPGERTGGEPVSDVMTPLERLAVVTPETPASEAFRLLAEHDVDQLPVLEGVRLLGVVRRRDLLRWIAFRSGLRDGSAT